VNKYLFTFITCLSILTNSFGQDTYIVLGDFMERWIIRFEVLDHETHTAIKHVKIEMFENTKKIFSITTDENGVGVVIVKRPGFIPAIGTIKITAPNYHYWEIEINQWQDFVEHEKDKLLVIPNKEDGGYISWSCAPCIPEPEKIASYLSNNDFWIWDFDYGYFMGPGLFEYKVKLEKVRHHLDSDK
jgi:hypothetical protein